MDKRWRMGYRSAMLTDGAAPPGRQDFPAAMQIIPCYFNEYATRHFGMVSARDEETNGEELP